MIELIGTSGCSRCLMVKSILAKRNINYTYTLFEDLTQNEQSRYMELAENQLTFPLILKENNIIDIKDLH